MGMLKLDPDQRFDISQVCQLCETYKESVGNKPQIDIYLIMDDIIEKLSLLDYETSFCRVWKSKPISRIYYAHPPHFGETQDQRLNYFFNMCYWLMSMNKEKVSEHFAALQLSFTASLQGLSCPQHRLVSASIAS